MSALQPFAYWSRWFTARKLAAERRRDPAWVERHERWAAIAGFNLQLDDRSEAEGRSYNSDIASDLPDRPGAICEYLGGGR